MSPQVQAQASIPEMLATIAAKVEALEANMKGGGGGDDRFGFYDMAGEC